MAIDSDRKRKSVAAISCYFIGPVVVADGTLAQADRQTVGYGYYGILAGAAAAVTAGPFYYLFLLAKGSR